MKHASNVKETTQTTGVGTLALDGPMNGHMAFGDVAYGAQVPYRVQIGEIFEIGLGTVQDNLAETGYELTRDLVLMSSSFPGYIDGDSNDLSAMQINLPSGSKEVFAIALDLSMVAQNINTGAAPYVGYSAEASGSGAMAVGMGAYGIANKSVAVGAGAGSSHDNSVVLGHTFSRGSGLFCRGAQRNGDASGFPTWFGDTLLSYLGVFSLGHTVLFPNSSGDTFAGKLTLIVIDSSAGNYVGTLQWLVIDGATLVITQALTQVYSTRGSPPALTVALATPSGSTTETSVQASVSGGFTADRIIIKTEVFGSP